MPILKWLGPSISRDAYLKYDILSQKFSQSPLSRKILEEKEKDWHQMLEEIRDSWSPDLPQMALLVSWETACTYDSFTLIVPPGNHKLIHPLNRSIIP